MARWDKLNTRGKVDDRRGVSPIMGGLGLTGVALMVAFGLLTGADVGDIVLQVANVALENPPTNTQQFEGNDEYEVFASTVLGSNNKLWTQKFSEQNLTYTEPTLVLFRNTTPSACGTATSQVGPHYCPLDQTIYLDETFFDELVNRLGAQGGEVAEAYVIAHEVAHHVQYQLGTLEQVQRNRSNQASINLELQADCYAGIWANSIKDQGVLEPGEIGQAMDAAAAVGDDRIQSQVNGQVNPETWTHGSSAQRVEWFTKGYNQGTISACDFN